MLMREQGINFDCQNLQLKENFNLYINLFSPSFLEAIVFGDGNGLIVLKKGT